MKLPLPLCSDLTLYQKTYPVTQEGQYSLRDEYRISKPIYNVRFRYSGTWRFIF